MRRLEFHRAIFNSFRIIQSEIETAKDLEALFNYVLYSDINTAYSKASLPDYLAILLTDEVRQNILTILRTRFNDSSLTLSNLAGKTANVTGDLFEAAIDEVGKAIVQAEADRQQIHIDLNNISSITGLDKRVLEFPKEVLDYLKNNAVKLRLSRKIQDDITESKFTTPKQMKVDVDYNNLRLNLSLFTTLSDKLNNLLSASFTAKNYNINPMHLEDIIQVQAYVGMVNYLSDTKQNTNNRFRSTKEILNIYKWYLEHDSENAFFYHLSHIVRIQALVGAGQTKVDVSSSASIFQGPAILPTYLIVNLRSKQKVYVRSTREIIQSIAKTEEQIDRGYKTAVFYRAKDGEIGDLYHS